MHGDTVIPLVLALLLHTYIQGAFDGLTATLSPRRGSSCDVTESFQTDAGFHFTLWITKRSGSAQAMLTESRFVQSSWMCLAGAGSFTC